MTVGVYRIFNVKNNKSYVGQSLDIDRRLHEHYRALNSLTVSHHSPKLQEDWDEYGPDAFEAEILEVCPEDKLEEREKYWIYFFDSATNGYNVRNCYNKAIKDELNKAIALLNNLKERI